MSIFNDWIETFKRNPGYNDAQAYNVRVARNPIAQWRIIGIHHLTPEENRGKHNLFVDVLDRDGQRVDGTKVYWVWEGMRPEENPGPLTIDKPAGETPDIPIDAGQKIAIRLNRSDAAIGFHTGHADEPGPNGELWNSIGHHSFFVVFQEVDEDPNPEPEPETQQIQIIVGGKVIFAADIVQTYKYKEETQCDTGR